MRETGAEHTATEEKVVRGNKNKMLYLIPFDIK